MLVAVSGRPRGEHPSKDELVAAALRCFVQRGYDATTMKQVAEEAGTSVAQLYLAFPSKQMMLVAVHQMGLRRLLDGFLLPAVEQGGEPWERIMALTEGYMRFYLDERDLANLLAFTSLADVDPNDAETQEMFREHGEQLVVLFSLWNDMTAGTGIEAAKVFRWCWAAMYGLAAQNMRFPHLKLSDDELESIVDTGMRLVRGGLMAARAQ